jgi:hypothetical protein
MSSPLRLGSARVLCTAFVCACALVGPARATTASTTTSFSSITVTTNYQLLSPGYSTPATLTQTDIASSGWDFVARSSVNTATFAIRGINSAGFGSGDNSSVRVQAGGIDYFELRANSSSFIFDFTSLDLRTSSTGTYKVEALDSSYNVVSGSAVTVTISAANTFQSTGDFSSNSAFTGIYGIRITAVTVTANWSPFVDNIVVANVRTPSPTISFATYDASTGALAVTGTNMTTGDTIAVNTLTLTGEGGTTYTLTSSNVTASSATAFSVTLNATDQAAVNQIFNKNGTSSTGGTTYNLAAASSWDSSASSAPASTTSAITVSNVAAPAITSATYNALTGSLVVTSTGLLKLNGATNDIVTNKFTITGQSGSTYTLTDTANVEITSGTSFTLALSATDKAAVNALLDNNGTSSSGGTTYNLAAAEDWNSGANASVVIADLTGNGITVTNAAPLVTSTLTASGTYGSAISTYTITGSNSPTSYGATGLPPGLSINTSNGQITGTPTDTTGSPYSVTISATNTGGTGSATLVFTISKAALTISGVTASNKTYDRTTSASLNTRSAAIVGNVNSDTLTIDWSGATGTFASRNVGTGQTVTIAGVTVTGTKASNYTLTQPTGVTADITAKTLTITGVTASNKTYDRTTSASLSTGSAALSGVVSGDTVTLDSSGASGVFSSKTAATGKTVTTSGFTIGGADSANYSLTQPTATADITAKTLTITGVTASNKTYDAGLTASLSTGSAALTGVIGGDAVTLDTSGATGAFSTKTIATGKTVTTSGFALSGADAANYSLTQPSTTADITAKTLTITGVTATNKVYDGTTSAALNTGSAALSGAIGGDSVSLDSSGATATFASKDAATGINVSISGFALSGTDASNYSLTQPTATADITAKTLTVGGVTASNKTYDRTTSVTLSGTAALQSAEAAGAGNTLDGKPYTGDTISLSGTMSGAFADKNVGTGKTITVTGLSLGGTQASNYTLGALAVTADITAKALTITGVTASNRTYDRTTSVSLDTSSAALSGVISGDTVTLDTSGATGTFSSKTVATGKTVTTSGFALGGTDAAN